jgi:hypothetical protein
MTIRTIGLDLAKSVFQAHGVDERGAATLTKRLHRKQMLPFFLEAAAVPDRDGGVRNGPLLGSHACCHRS